tara:strand:+ start:128 stop:418 length:291 start_codon:yes stop_codon:yes gene_type:complete
MKVSESIINNLLMEVDSLTFRLRSIKLSFNTTSNSRLKERFIYENKAIFERVNDINKTAKYLNKNVTEKISFSSLLIEKSKRTLKEIKTESNLFFL